MSVINILICIWMDGLPPNCASYVDAGFKSGTNWSDCAGCRDGHQSPAGHHLQPAVRQVDEGDCRGKVEALDGRQEEEMSGEVKAKD